MSIDFKINHKEELTLPKPPPPLPNIEDLSYEEQKELKLKKRKAMMEQKYKIDIIDALGASTDDKNGTPFNFLTQNNYIIYKVGQHLIIKDCPPNDEDIYSEQEMNKQANSFFIYLPPESKRITSMQVSLDRNNFVLGEEIEDNNGKKYSTISVYTMDKLDIETFYMMTPARKIITDKFNNFRSINFSDDNKYICTICNEINSGKSFGLIYDISENREFKMNLIEPYIIIDLIKETINNNIILDPNSFTFNKISIDKNNIVCVTGKNVLNFWFIYKSIFGKIPFILDKNYNYIDHAFYKFTKDQKIKDDNNLNKNSVLITITSSNELYILQSTQKKSEQSDNEDEITDEINILSSYSGIEQFIVKFHLINIFENISCLSEKICIINSNTFNGLLIGNNFGDIVIYEKTRKDDVNSFEYVFMKKYEKKENKSRCTSIISNFNGSLVLITYEKKEASFINLKSLIQLIKINSSENKLSILNDGFHSYPLKTFDISIQRPILVTSSLANNKIKIWNYLSGYSENCQIILPQGQRQLIEKFVILSFALHPNGYNIVLSNEEMLWFFFICHKQIRFYGNEVNEINGNKKTKKKIILQKRNNIYLLKFLYGGDKLVAVNNSKNVFIIETFTREVKTCIHLNHQGIINDINFSNDNSYMYSFGSDGCIYEVNMKTEEVERIISELITYTQGIVFSSFESKNIIVNDKSNRTESKMQTYHNIIACGYDVKESYSITEVTYIPTNLNIERKEFVVISSDITYIKDKISCIILIFPKKIEKKCLICGTKDGKIIIYPYPIKDATNKLDEIYSHTGEVKKIKYIREINMLISCGEDGNFFIYSLFEIFGETVLYEKNFENIFKLNTALDISLGSSFLFPVNELEKVELNKNEEKEVIERFEEEKEKIEYEHKNKKKNIIVDMEKKLEEEKNNLEKIVKEKETKMKDDEIKLKKALEDKNNELINNLKNDVKNNFNRLHDYQEEIKALKEKIKSNKEKYKNDIEQRKKDYENKYFEIKKGFDDKIISLLEDQKKLKEKYSNEKKDKKAFILNIEKETYLEEKIRAMEEIDRIDEFEINKGNLNYEIIKYKDIVEKLEKKIKEKKAETEELSIKEKYLEKKLDNYTKNNADLIYEKEKAIEEFKALQSKLQEDDVTNEFNQKLRVELYKQKYELITQYKTTAIENKNEEINNKSLSKNIINLTNHVFATVRDKNKVMSELEKVKNDNERLRSEVNINFQKLDNIIQKIFRSFQTNIKGDVVKCLCEIYKIYVNDDFIKRREKKLIDKKVILELEKQINTLEEQISNNKSQIKEMKNLHDIYKEEKIRENSILIARYEKDNINSQNLERNISKLQSQSKILTNEISRIRNENSTSLITSNNASKEFRKNISTNEILPKIKFNDLYKYKNSSSMLPSSILKSDNEDYSPSKKGSLFSKTNDSRVQNSVALSEHISFID